LVTCTCIFEAGNCFQGNIDACNFNLGQFDMSSCTCTYPPQQCEQDEVDQCTADLG
jgi:hypothetical protein